VKLYDLSELTRQLRKALERGEPPAARSALHRRSTFPGSDGLPIASMTIKYRRLSLPSMLADIPRWQLAEQYKISVRSVGRLLRKWRRRGMRWRNRAAKYQIFSHLLARIARILNAWRTAAAAHAPGAARSAVTRLQSVATRAGAIRCWRCCSAKALARTRARLKTVQ
jgi:hypothetical protein